MRRILVNAPRYLTPNGVLIVEVGNSRTEVMAAYPDLPFIWLDLEENEAESGVFMLTARDLVTGSSS